MVDIPSIFDKPTFLGVLLPGYIAVILTVGLIFPELVPIQEDKGISLDLFSAIVFIVAGPAVGYTLRQLHRILYTVLKPNYSGKKRKKEASH